jgi:geranylgeranyl diphosphate synthase type I
MTTDEGLAGLSARYRVEAEREMREVVGRDPAQLFGWMRYHMGWEDAAGEPTELATGKMARPTALLLAHEACGGDWQQALPAAAAVELVHNFSLIHDDIEDQSDRRHGRETLWSLVGEAHAINVGDGMYTVARLSLYRLLDRGVPLDTTIACMAELDRACLELVRGQALDIAFEDESRVSREQYLSMVTGKTAAMFAAPLAMGALLAGVDHATVDALRRLGLHLGVAFQAADDVLGIWGDPAVTGKPAGDDLRTRKMTLPVISALHSSHPAQSEIERLYSRPPADTGEESSEDAEIAELTTLIEQAGGRHETEALAHSELDSAHRLLSDVGFSPRMHGLFEELANAMVGRVA